MLKRFPSLLLWEGGAELITMRYLPTGGQRFVFSFKLLNGCHACVIAGYAHIDFDFDASGNFSGTKLLRLSGARPVQ